MEQKQGGQCIAQMNELRKMSRPENINFILELNDSVTTSSFIRLSLFSSPKYKACGECGEPKTSTASQQTNIAFVHFVL